MSWSKWVDQRRHLTRLEIERSSVDGWLSLTIKKRLHLTNCEECRRRFRDARKIDHQKEIEE